MLYHTPSPVHELLSLPHREPLTPGPLYVIVFYTGSYFFQHGLEGRKLELLKQVQSARRDLQEQNTEE